MASSCGETIFVWRVEISRMLCNTRGIAYRHMYLSTSAQEAPSPRNLAVSECRIPSHPLDKSSCSGIANWFRYSLRISALTCEKLSIILAIPLSSNSEKIGAPIKQIQIYENISSRRSFVLRPSTALLRTLRLSSFSTLCSTTFLPSTFSMTNLVSARSISSVISILY